MSACVERSLYVGITGKFDLFDNVKLKLKNGVIMEGQIVGIGDYEIALADDEDIREYVSVSDIDDYLN